MKEWKKDFITHRAHSSWRPDVMATAPLDRCRVPQAIWRAVEYLGLSPTAVLRHAGLPPMLHLNPKTVVKTEQLFAIWRALEDLASDPAFGIKMVEAADKTGHQPAFLAACYAADYRDGISRIARFMRLVSCEHFRFEERGRELHFRKCWPFAKEPEPAFSIDATFACLLKLGRKGTDRHLTPVRVEYARSGPQSAFHENYFGCEIRYGAPFDQFILSAEDADRPFPGHNMEFLDFLVPAFAAALDDVQAESSTGDQVKMVVKRALANGRPDIAEVAQDLGLGERTLQRRITDEGTTFRGLLAEARRELGLELLADPSINVDCIAAMLGYQDTSSFYRAFKDWLGITPKKWRAVQGR